MSSVVVIGAGVAGLTAAYRLRQAGHRVTVLEAKPHAGGLSTTARDGSVVTEVHDGELVTQTVQLPEGCYINLGPGRLPHHHRRILALCRELRVPLEPYIMSSDATYYADAATGARYRRRRLDHDARGYIAEIAHQLDGGEVFDANELALLRSFGDLGPDGIYRGTDRAGGGKPVSFEQLTRMRFWDYLFWQPSAYLWQDSMFQPCGGMDQIWRALLATGIEVRYNAPVQRIRQRGRRVQVTWSWGGQRVSESFDWCLSSVPLPLLAQMDLQGFSQEYLEAVQGAEFAPACKVGWTSLTRWWEDDEIYGGISYSSHDIRQFWYPSVGHFAVGPATLTGAYNSYEPAARYQDMSVPDRLVDARRGGMLLHPEMGDGDLVPDEMAATVAWARVPYQAGGWAHWDPARPEHETWFDTLQRADGRFVAIGCQVSQWPGWQEGAVATAERAVAMVTGAELAGGEVGEAVETGVPVPDSRWLTEGDHPARGGKRSAQARSFREMWSVSDIPLRSKWDDTPAGASGGRSPR